MVSPDVLKIIIIEDNRYLVDDLQDLASFGAFEGILVLAFITSLEEANQAIDTNTVTNWQGETHLFTDADMVLVDHHLTPANEGGGQDLISKVRNLSPEIMTVGISAQEGMPSNADDYFGKTNLGRLSTTHSLLKEILARYKTNS